MRKSDCVVFVIFDCIYLFAAGLMSHLIGSLVIKAVERFVDLDFSGEAAVLSLVILGCMAAMIAILSYRDGYRYATFDTVGSTVAAGVAGLVYFLVGIPFRFAPVVFGPTRHFAGLVAYGDRYASDLVGEISLGIMIAVGVIILLVYAAVTVLAGYVGYRKRLRQRAELMGDQTASK